MRAITSSSWGEMRGEIPFSIVTVIYTGSEFNQWGAEMITGDDFFLPMQALEYFMSFGQWV
jgi:hypothetical protein